MVLEISGIQVSNARVSLRNVTCFKDIKYVFGNIGEGWSKCFMNKLEQQQKFTFTNRAIYSHSCASVSVPRSSLFMILEDNYVCN
jgi:hypothetical protein